MNFFSDRSPGTDPKLVALLARQRAVLQAALEAGLKALLPLTPGMVDRLLDTLFNDADMSRIKGGDQRKLLAVYSIIYERKAELREKIDQQLKTQLDRGIEEFLLNREVAYTGRSTMPKTMGSALSLVDTDEVELMVIARSAGARVENNYIELVRKLNGRIAAVSQLEDLPAGTGPFRPELIAMAIDSAWREMRTDSSQDLLVIERVGPAMLGDLSNYFAALIEALPEAAEVPHRLVRDAEPTRTTPSATIADSHPSEEKAITSGFAKIGGLLKRVQHLLMRQSAGSANSNGPGGNSGDFGNGQSGYAGYPGWSEAGHQAFMQIVPVDALTRPVSALSALQHAQFEHPDQFARAMSIEQTIGSDGAPSGSNYMDPMSPVDMVLGAPLRFVNVIRSIAHTDIAKAADQNGSVVIELVARLFDFVFEDTNLHDPIKVLLSRLQIPVLKAAMLDTDFFEMENHPARRMVNALAAAAVGWDEQSGRDDPVYKKIEETVARVLNEFEEDLSLFELLTSDLEEFARRFDEEAEAAIAPQLEVAADTARLDETKSFAVKTALKAIDQRVRHQPTTGFVLEFLRRPWAEFVGERILVNQGDDQELRQVLTATDDLLWSVLPKADADARRNLLVKIPKLETQLREAATTVSYPDDDTDEFFKALDDRWAGAVIGEPLQLVDAPDEDEPQVDSSLQQIFALRIGGILEMTKDDGARLCYKVGWISEGKTRYLLTNRLNSAPLIVSAEHLASQMRVAKLRIIDPGALVDRALNNILVALEEVRFTDTSPFPLQGRA